MSIYPEILSTIYQLEKEFDLIPEERKNRLKKLANYIASKTAKGVDIQLNFICTHNSRRSHLGQIWAATAAHYFGIQQLQSFSGGTEATAFNTSAIAALERLGFQIDHTSGKNPHYMVHYAYETAPLECFSKVYDDPFNPVQHFAAVMTCSDADDNCPFIPGAEQRIALTYEDPKISDGSPQEAATYEERARQIGRELLFAFHQLA